MASKKPVVVKDQASEDDKAAGEVAKWVAEIKLYERESLSWMERSKKIVKRYKDEREAKSTKSRYNILWSNVQTLSPALYASVPKPNVDRRWQDDDDLGRIAAQVLERSATYFVHTDLFDSMMHQSVIDRLLPGRGTAWVRYVPNFRDASVQGTEEVKQEGVSTTDDVIKGDEGTFDPEQELYSEEVIPDYVHWQDFGHTWARTWEEVRAVWKRVFLTRQELVARFGDVGNEVPLDYAPEKLNDEKVHENLKKATVYEIWDKTTKKAIWIHKDYGKRPLDEKDDPLRLKDFFPCPKPTYATLANDSLIPVPDYIQYQDQATELDELTARIRSIAKSLKVAGIYDGSAEGIQRILAEGVENTLIKVDNWAVFQEKGGIAGAMSFLPMKDVAATLLQLYDARDRCLQIIYAITGISDIIRGASNPNETATAQEIKGKYANLRLDDQQKDIARYGRDIVRIMTEIIAEHFSIDTIKQISGVKLLTIQEKQQIEMQQQAMAMAQQAGEQPAPVPDEIQELLKLPTWEDVEKLIRNDAARCFRIDIETDSTIKTDQDAEKQARTEFLGAAAGFIAQASQVPNPELQPLLMEMLMFGIRGFKVGREMETTFQMTIDKLKKAAENPQPQADPAAAEKEIEQMRLQTNQQIEGQKIASNEKIEGAKIQSNERIELIKTQAETQRHMANTEADVKKSRIDAKTKVSPDVAMTDNDLNEGEQTPMAALMAQVMQGMSQGFQVIAQGQQQLAEMQMQSNERIIEAIVSPKEVIRDAQGKIVASRTVMQ